MIQGKKNILALYVDRTAQQWVVLDSQGNYWLVPQGEENGWDQRQPFCPTEKSDLQPVPGHYRYLLGVPA